MQDIERIEAIREKCIEYSVAYDIWNSKEELPYHIRNHYAQRLIDLKAELRKLIR